jgi:uncharacterized protein (DUF983 family)
MVRGGVAYARSFCVSVCFLVLGVLCFYLPLWSHVLCTPSLWCVGSLVYPRCVFFSLDGLRCVVYT